MALPSNYKQIAVGAPTGPSTPAPSGGSRSRSSGAGGGSDRNKDTTPIFSHSNYGNPAFTPQKAGKTASSKNQAETRLPKPPKPPEKPLLPHMRYSKRMWDSVKEQYPELKLWELGKKIGDMWSDLSDIDKQEFIDEYEADKLDYEKNLKAYHNSPAYQTYLAAKSKLRSDVDVHETPSRSSGKSSQERRIDIQPAEDEDDPDEGYSFKHLAYARYLRNHRLINEIFSDAVVPDVRSVVTTQRMQVLKRQVSSLTMHQTKLEAELQQMEEKFEAKKQRMMESSEAFQEELKRHCKPAVDEETLQKMVTRMYEEMKRPRLEEPNPNVANQALKEASIEKTTQAQQVSNSASNNPPGPGPTAAAQGPSNTAKKESPPSAPNSSAAPKTGNQEIDSKTEPEPMDIEPPQKATPANVPKVENNPNEPSKPGKSPSEKDAPAKNGTPAKANMPTNKDATPAPAPTPPAQQPQATPNPLEGQPIPPPQQHGPPAVAPNVQPMGPQVTPPPPSQPQPQQQPPQQQLPPSMPMHPHHARQPHPHLPPHLQQHQPPMAGMPPHPSYANYGSPSGPTRSPYYQPQYGGHPAQPYGQYPYSHYAQPYGPPPGSHYMNRPPPPQHNGSPVHYPEHGAPMVPQQPPGHMPHDPYQQQVPQHPGPPQQPGMPPVAVPPGVAPPTSAPTMPSAGPSQTQPSSAEPTKSEADKSDE